MIRRAGVAAALALAVTLLAGCGGSDSVSSDGAKQAMASAIDEIRADLEGPGLGDRLEPWQAVTAQAPDVQCPEGAQRWRTSASISVTDRTGDGDSAVARLVGVLTDPWDTSTGLGELDEDASAVVPAARGEGPDRVEADITVVPARGGWTYLVVARGACITD